MKDIDANESSLIILFRYVNDVCVVYLMASERYSFMRLWPVAIGKQLPNVKL